MDELTRDEIIDRARDEYADDENVEFDDDARLSCGHDVVWVQAWICITDVFCTNPQEGEA